MILGTAEESIPLIEISVALAFLSLFSTKVTFVIASKSFSKSSSICLG
jgi:hypothetical protein